MKYLQVCGERPNPNRSLGISAGLTKTRRLQNFPRLLQEARLVAILRQKGRLIESDHLVAPIALSKCIQFFSTSQCPISPAHSTCLQQKFNSNVSK